VRGLVTRTELIKLRGKPGSPEVMNRNAKDPFDVKRHREMTPWI
jgi:hypothetical protein